MLKSPQNGLWWLRPFTKTIAGRVEGSGDVRVPFGGLYGLSGDGNATTGRNLVKKNTWKFIERHPTVYYGCFAREMGVGYEAKFILGYRARWVMDFEQRHNFPNCSPVAAAASIKILFSYVDIHDLKWKQFDMVVRQPCKNRSIYMRQPTGFETLHLVCVMAPWWKVKFPSVNSYIQWVKPLFTPVFLPSLTPYRGECGIRYCQNICILLQKLSFLPSVKSVGGSSSLPR
jgi:hypothetical protein